MASMLITNIRSLVNVGEKKQLLRGAEMSFLPCLEDAYLLVEDEEIAGFGTMKSLIDGNIKQPTNIVNAGFGWVLPAWCDSHTHLVFAGSREIEFVDKLKGKSYADIHAAGGGILNSAHALNHQSENALFTEAWKRLEEIAALGTGAVEIKSGYGLTVEAELKMLRVIQKLKEKSSLTIRATFLGAHTYPSAYREDHGSYIKLIIEEMLPVIAREKLADYIDVFCENGFFNPAEMETICRAGMSYGLKPKLHVNQLNSIGGIKMGIDLRAVSLDHLETMTEEDLKLLSSSYQSPVHYSGPLATLLPTAAFFLRLPFQPARRLIDSGCAVALASDYNPGSSPSGNMNFVVSLSCIQMRMLPEEAINAATINGAFAMECAHDHGTISQGKKASLIITKPVPSLAYLPYSFGTNWIDNVMIKGTPVNDRRK
jgi:imidazolonepropionase